MDIEQAWREDLLRQITLGRGQLLEASQNHGVQYLIFKQRNPTPGPLKPANLVFVQAVRPNQPYRMPTLWGVNDIVCIAVALGQRYTHFKLAMTSRQNIKGTIEVSLGYEVQNPISVVQSPDVLGHLMRFCQDAVQSVVGVRNYSEVSLDLIRHALRQVKADALGLVLTDVVLPQGIVWDEKVAGASAAIAEAEAKALKDRNVILIGLQTDRERRHMIEEELARYGIRDVETIAEITALIDPRDPNIAQAIKKVLAERRQEREKQQARDEATIETLRTDKQLTRQQIEDLGDGAIDRLNRGRNSEQRSIGTTLSPRQANPHDPRDPRVSMPELPHNPTPGLPQGSQPMNHYSGPPYPDSPGYQGPQQPYGYAPNSNPEYPQPHQQSPAGPGTPNTIPAQGQGPRQLIEHGEMRSQPAPAYLFDLTHHTGSFILSYPATFLGRKASLNHIVITNDSVSRQHCVIAFHNGVFYIHNHEKMSPENYTLVNGVRVSSQATVLNDGSEIIIGDARLQFRLQRNQPPLLEDDTSTHFR